MTEDRLKEIEARRVKCLGWEAFCAETYELLEKDVPELLVALQEARTELSRKASEITCLKVDLANLKGYFEAVNAEMAQARGQTDRELCGATVEEQRDWYYMANNFLDCGHPADCILCDQDGKDYCPLCELERRKNLYQQLYLKERQQAAQAREAGYREAIEAAKDILWEYGWQDHLPDPDAEMQWITKHSKRLSELLDIQLEFPDKEAVEVFDIAFQRAIEETATETPAGMGEIGETMNETEGNRPFVRVVEARLIHGEEGE